jgi:hypothetical protein
MDRGGELSAVGDFDQDGARRLCTEVDTDDRKGLAAHGCP